MSVHSVADASQKFTCPVVTLIEPETTVAVNVTSLPEATDPPEATVLPPEVIVRVVAVAAGAAQACGVARNKGIIKPMGERIRLQDFNFKADSVFTNRRIRALKNQF
jgi:hypothetical protein